MSKQNKWIIKMVIGPRNDQNVFYFGKPQFRVSLRLQYG